MRHPKTVLFAGEKPFPILPAVDHYAGSEKLMKKALLLQKELGPIFDITCDCEDGAHAGAEREHAEMAAGIVYGFPCECKGGSFKIIQGLEINEYSREKMNFTLKELTDEAEAVKDML